MIEFQTTTLRNLWIWYSLHDVLNLTALCEKRYPATAVQLNTFPGDVLATRDRTGPGESRPGERMYGIVVSVEKEDHREYRSPLITVLWS